MSSFDSNKSGYLHPHYQQQPPYPTTPAPMSQPQQPPFYPSQPSQQQPTSQPSGTAMMAPQPRDRRSSSFSRQRPDNLQSMAIPIRQPNPTDYFQASRTPPSSYPPPPPVYAQPMPVYARSASHSSHHSHHSQHMHDPHAFADGEDKYEHRYGGPDYAVIDEETEREYERRYAREKRADRDLESRPTLGGSLMSMVGKVGRAFSSERR